jgi:hypothetical protein
LFGVCCFVVLESSVQRLVLVVSAGVTPGQVATHLEQQQAAAGGASGTSGTATATATAGRSASPPPRKMAADRAAAAAAAAIKVAAIAKEENVRRVDRWRLMYPFFPFIAKQCSFLAHSLKGMKSASFRIKYHDFGEFLFKCGIMNLHFGRWFRPYWTHTVGFIRSKFQAFSAKYLSEFTALHSYLSEFLQVCLFIFACCNCSVSSI